jgi:adenine-specific DNA-methyltransferase
LNKSRIADAAYKYNETLLQILLSHEGLKKQFFQEVAGATIFLQRDFLNFLSNKSFLKDSYTEFKNQIGLQDEKGEYFRENKDVVLVFPYKDCILEGGQDKEEQKRDEIFYNETLAPDEITRLFDTKALTNFKLYDSKGEHTLAAKSEIDFSQQNLILKGNNLLALHSLKKIKSIAGQVKLIYIDPPYNTNNDEFNYNDKFRQSTWLTFMKNRLEVARQLLAEDGVILVQISDIRVGVLRVLMDEIFEPQNFINQISVKTKSPSGFKTVNLGVFETAEHIIFYGKNKKKWKYRPQYVKSEYDSNYKFEVVNIDDKSSKWKIKNIEETISEKDGYKTVKEAKEKLGAGVFHEKMAEYALLNSHKVFRYTEINDDAGKETLEAKEKSLSTPDKVIEVPREDKDNRYVINGNEISFYSKKIREIDGEKVPTVMLTNIWTDIAWEGIAKEGRVKLKKGKKPERLIRRIIEMSTSEGDLVIDFHLGSGTTAAVAHKLKRRYIGIEQLDYEENGSVTRLTNVIDGDKTGISKFVNWQGGGSFIYTELKRYNQFYIDEIEKAKDTKALRKLYEQMKEEAFFRIEVDHSKWDNGYFEKLTLKEQKEFLAECLDKNHLYVNLTEMEDAHYKMSKDEIALNKKFYNLS